jgi:hypothetical protein
VCQSTVAWDAAPSAGAAVICLASLGGLPSSRVPSDRMEVCPLSRGVLLPAGSSGRRNPYPPDYGAAFASSILLYPPPRGRPSRSAVPARGGRRAYHVPRSYPDGTGPASPPVARLSAAGER